MLFEEKDFGYEFHSNQFLCFFGKFNSELQNLYKSYPNLDWVSLKQIHSDVLVESSQGLLNSTEADAHWSTKKNLALVTRTADCVPLLGYNTTSKNIISIHAGWKGVASGIVPKSLKKIAAENPLQDWQLFMGPHILQESFEIQSDVLKLLEKSTDLSSENWATKDKNSYFVDLSKVLLAQIQSIGVPTGSVEKCLFDTKTNLKFHSHRRDRELSGRQISFIAKF